MRVDIHKSIKPSIDRNGASGWVPLVMLALGIPWGVWSFAALVSGGGSQSVALDAAAGWFVLLAIGYLGLHGLRGLAWWSVPVLLTLRALVEFICIPAWRFASGDDLVDTVYVHAMFLTSLGFAAFWIGSLVVMKETGLRFVPQTRDTSSRVAFMSAATLGLGMGGNLVLWKAGLFSYTADAGLRDSSLGIIQWMTFFANLLNAALVISAIEVFGKRSVGPLIKIVFWTSFICSIGFGVISGMKGSILAPLLILVVVCGITRGRIPRVALMFPLLPVLIYPFVNAYRENLNNGYRDQINTLGGLATALDKSFVDVVLSRASTREDSGKSFDQATGRLSLLTYVHDIIGLPDPSLLNGSEKIWLAPFYPLVPRALWKDKPVLDKGSRLSVALGRPATTSSAVTPIGDLYSMYGTYGVALGMLVYGIFLQLYMNWVGGNCSEKGLFIYISMLIPLTNLENAMVALVAGAVQVGLVLLVVSYIIYGQSLSSLRFAGYPRPIATS
jgi:hypothetical protein